MTRGRISVGRRWFARLFPGWAGPIEVDDTVVLTTPMEGTGRYADLQFQQFTATANSFVNSSVVPNDQQWWIPWCSIHHNDPALSEHMWLAIRNIADKEVTIAGSPDVTEQRKVSIRRPIIIVEGQKLSANAKTVTAAGKKIFLNMFFVEMPIGEFVPPL